MKESRETVSFDEFVGAHFNPASKSLCAPTPDAVIILLRILCGHGLDGKGHYGRDLPTGFVVRVPCLCGKTWVGDDCKLGVVLG